MSLQSGLEQQLIGGNICSVQGTAPARVRQTEIRKHETAIAVVTSLSWKILVFQAKSFEKNPEISVLVAMLMYHGEKGVKQDVPTHVFPEEA